MRSVERWLLWWVSLGLVAGTLAVLTVMNRLLMEGVSIAGIGTLGAYMARRNFVRHSAYFSRQYLLLFLVAMALNLGALGLALVYLISLG